MAIAKDNFLLLPPDKLIVYVFKYLERPNLAQTDSTLSLLVFNSE